MGSSFWYFWKFFWKKLDDFGWLVYFTALRQSSVARGCDFFWGWQLSRHGQFKPPAGPVQSAYRAGSATSSLILRQVSGLESFQVRVNYCPVV